MFLLPVLCLLCCTPMEKEAVSDRPGLEEEGEEIPSIILPVYSPIGAVSETTFVQVCTSEHAAAYVSAHAVDAHMAQAMLDVFEEMIYPALPEPDVLEGKKLNILICYMEGSVYGYMPSELQSGEQGPLVFLNALYTDDLAYALAHEYQHFCAFDACAAGHTVISEETDELLSDMFTELLFPGRGRERGILSEDRTLAAQERIEGWGKDALPHAYDLLRAGYAEKELLLTLEKGEG